MFEVVGVCGRWFQFVKGLMSFEMQQSFSTSTKREKEIERKKNQGYQ
jgi:hypothetical protein